MTPQQAQNIAELWANFHSEDIRLSEIKQALVCLANYYEDTQFDMKHKRKAGVDNLSEKHTIISDKVKTAINLLKGSTWQSMNDKMIAQRVIELLGNTE